MSSRDEIDYRPATYFRPQRLEEYLFSKIKGAVVRKKLQALFREGRHAEAVDLVGTAGISETDRLALEATHPMFMGGNYLPDASEGEVEIARIRLSSTTYDVTCVYARSDERMIRYRVVDEYDGDTLTSATEMSSAQPLTLGELTDFVFGAWPLIDVLESNFEHDLEQSLDFFDASSDFYLGFDAECRGRVIEHFQRFADDDDSEA